MQRHAVQALVLAPPGQGAYGASIETRIALRRAGGGLLGVVLAGLALWYVFRSTEPAMLARGFSEIAWPWFALAMAAHMAATCAQGARLRVFVNEVGRISLWRAIQMMPVVYAAANLIPLRGSELVKARLLVRLGGMSYTRSAGVITADHAFAAAGLMLAGVGVWWLGHGAEWLADFLLLGAAFVVVAAAVAMLVERRRGRDALSRLEHRLHAFTESFRIFVKPREAAQALALTACAWTLEAMVGLAVLQAVGIEPTWMRALLMLLGVNAAGILPLTPGHVGIYELAAAFVLTRTGADPSAAALAAVLYHVAHIVPALTLAGTFVAASKTVRNGLTGSWRRAKVNG